MTQRNYFDRLAELESWEGDSEIPRVSPHALLRARQFLDISGSDPSIFPTYEGGISLEWLTEHQHMTVEFFAETDPERLDGEVFIFDARDSQP